MGVAFAGRRMRGAPMDGRMGGALVDGWMRGALVAGYCAIAAVVNSETRANATATVSNGVHDQHDAWRASRHTWDNTRCTTPKEVDLFSHASVCWASCAIRIRLLPCLFPTER